MADSERNAQFEQLLHTINHDLRTPLGNIRAALAILRQDLGTLLTEDQRIFFSIIDSSVIRILDQSNRLGLFTELSFGQLQREQVRLSELLANTKKIIRSNYNIEEISFTTNRDPLVNCHSHSLVALLALLASGDYKHLSEAELSTIQAPNIDVHTQDNQIIFIITGQMPATESAPSFANLANEIVQMLEGTLEMGAKNGRFHATLTLPHTS